MSVSAYMKMDTAEQKIMEIQKVNKARCDGIYL